MSFMKGDASFPFFHFRAPEDARGNTSRQCTDGVAVCASSPLGTPIHFSRGLLNILEGRRTSELHERRCVLLLFPFSCSRGCAWYHRQCTDGVAICASSPLGTPIHFSRGLLYILEGRPTSELHERRCVLPLFPFSCSRGYAWCHRQRTTDGRAV